MTNNKHKGTVDSTTTTGQQSMLPWSLFVAIVAIVVRVIRVSIPSLDTILGGPSGLDPDAILSTKAVTDATVVTDVAVAVAGSW
jgi:hypothetical protein